MLKQYVRGSGKHTKRVMVTDGNGRRHQITKSFGGQRVGVLIATLNNEGQIVIGHSKWHRHYDEYDPEFMEQVAEDRINTGSTVAPALSIAKNYLNFIERAQRYFKGANLSDSTKSALKNLDKKFQTVKMANAGGCGGAV